MIRYPLSLLVFLGLTACADEPAPAPAPAPVEPTAPAPEPAAEYPICDRAPPADGSAPPRAGDPGRQLAPVTMDRMTDCKDADEAPPEAAAVADAGALNDRGDCVWTSGPSCHYHASVEFIAPNSPAAEGTRELHCIFPNAAEPNSPEVFGGHFVCKAGTATTDQGAAGAACGAGLLPALRAALVAADENVRCCDDGTLTAVYETQTPEQRLLRPDFHITPTPMELDCSALAGMAAHSAYGSAPAHGAH